MMLRNAIPTVAGAGVEAAAGFAPSCAANGAAPRRRAKEPRRRSREERIEGSGAEGAGAETFWSTARPTAPLAVILREARASDSIVRPDRDRDLEIVIARALAGCLDRSYLQIFTSRPSVADTPDCAPGSKKRNWL